MPQISLINLNTGQKQAIAIGAWIAAPDGSGRRLIAALDSAMSFVTTWSPDRKWVAVTVLEIKRDTTLETLLLIQPETCQVAALPGISGTITGWQ
jgi:hypothetical protein